MTNPRPRPGGKVRVLRRQVKQPFTRDVVLVVRCQRVDQAVLRRVSDLEHQRAEFVAQLNELRARKQQAAGAGAIEPDQVRTLLRRLMLEIAERAEEPDHRAEARQALGEVLERVVLDPDLHTVRLHYAVATGVNLASPRGFEPL
jgi:uncharacterized protein (DUF3084 family)